MKTFVKEQLHLLLAGVWAVLLAIEINILLNGTRSVLGYITGTLDVVLIVLNLLLWHDGRKKRG